MTPAKNRKLVNDLRASLDAAATKAAMDRGDITPIQARNIVQWIDQVREIHANPLHVVKNGQGHIIGEVAASEAGAKWTGRRFGTNYADGVTFSNCEAAIAFVTGQAEV